MNITLKNKILEIPFEGSKKIAVVAFRVFDNNNQVLYKSSRLGDIRTTDTGYSVEVSDDISLDGKDFELKDVQSRKVISSGKIIQPAVQETSAEAENSSVPDLPEKPKTKKEKTV